MTWSIIARDPATGAFAVAIATANLAVGASCPYLRAGVGAVSTQSMTNRYLGPAVLDGLARGLAPAAAIEGALSGDEGRHLRQVHAIDRHGRTAAWTGRNCVDWAGDHRGHDFSVAGNMLSGPATLADTVAAFATMDGLPLPERLVAAMLAGEAAGGDRRGRQSAALVLTTTEDFPDIDLRVDDHTGPVEELQRLLGVWRVQREPGMERSPSKARPSGVTDLDELEADWIRKGLPLRFKR
ncbi:putative Ntn-hydrolase superfamily protein [Humitalea rosea]|uniref:Putative Ntn-hydrolase superfamily protein n=1 Tax=Humitalea rosea TaxID=990373 RepID=A0A2W7I5V8_9PROT|nr:DUF1028 domain-containing protein [Humitalea rosea]PZW42261.1 putative Ntn-hydrolase superfamily protein [Humitalea rosea]